MPTNKRNIKLNLLENYLSDKTFSEKNYQELLRDLYDIIKFENLTKKNLREILLTFLGEYNLLNEHIYVDLANIYLHKHSRQTITMTNVLNIV